DDGIAVTDRRRDLPGRDGDRKIPRRDDADDSDRLPGHRDFDAGPHARHGLAGKAQGLAREEIENLAGADGLADAFGERLAFLARKQSADLLAPLQDRKSVV